VGPIHAACVDGDNVTIGATRVWGGSPSEAVEAAAAAGGGKDDEELSLAQRLARNIKQQLGMALDSDNHCKSSGADKGVLASDGDKDGGSEGAKAANAATASEAFAKAEEAASVAPGVVGVGQVTPQAHGYASNGQGFLFVPAVAPGGAQSVYAVPLNLPGGAPMAPHFSHAPMPGTYVPNGFPPQALEHAGDHFDYNRAW